MKYPRTWHLPESPGGTRDDRRLTSLASFVGRPIVITEKMDGSNVCLEAHACFARSHGHAPAHPSFSGLKAFHAAARLKIPPGFQVFGEWLYARHSIHYTQLESYLQLFALHDRGEVVRPWRSWRSLEAIAAVMGTITVPVLRRLQVSTEAELRIAMAEVVAGLGRDSEGFTIRWESDFTDAEFKHAVAKWVRAGHVSTEEHWKSQAIVRNGLSKPTL